MKEPPPVKITLPAADPAYIRGTVIAAPVCYGSPPPSGGVPARVPAPGPHDPSVPTKRPPVPGMAPPTSEPHSTGPAAELLFPPSPAGDAFVLRGWVPLGDVRGRTYWWDTVSGATSWQYPSQPAGSTLAGGSTGGAPASSPPW